MADIDDVGPDAELSTPAGGRRQRGRPQRLPHERMPHEASPQARASLDERSRTAWLVATTRLLSPASRHCSRTEFVEQVRGHGVSLDASRLSRWESGALPATPVLLSAYELVSQRPPGSLRAAQLAIQRVAGRARSTAAAPPSTTPRSKVTVTEADDDVLDDIFRRVGRGDATGGDWLTLASECVRYERVYLHPDTWAELCGRLVNELTRAGGPAFTRRFEAAALLMRHRAGRRHLSRSLGEFVMHPDVQNATPALSLLVEVGDQSAVDLVVKLMREPRRELRGGAVRVAATMASHGQLGDDDAAALEALVRLELGVHATERRLAAVEVAYHLPENRRDRLLGLGMGDHARQLLALAFTTGELVPADYARRVADTVASRAERALERHAHEPDLMLRLLVREGLFHVQRERRSLAVTLLAASPYAAAVASALVELTEDRNDLLASACWSALRRLGHVVDRAALAPSLHDQRQWVAPRVRTALGLAGGELADDVADELVDSAVRGPSPAVRQSSIFALGMAGHPRLKEVLASGSPGQHAAARWWLEAGSAVRDEDVLAR